MPLAAFQIWEIEALLTKRHKEASESQETGSNTELHWACSAAVGAVHSSLPRMHSSTQKEKKLYCKLGVSAFTVDKALGYLRVSLLLLLFGSGLQNSCQGSLQDISSGDLWKGAHECAGNREAWVPEEELRETLAVRVRLRLPHPLLLVWLLSGSPGPPRSQCFWALQYVLLIYLSPSQITPHVL